MKFSESPVIHLTVGGAALSFEQDNNSFQVGTSVWPSSLVLAKFADRWHHSSPTPNPYSPLLSFSGKRAVELGSGCGPAGISLSALNLAITLTDIPSVLPALRRNLKRNRSLLPKPLPKHKPLCWNNADQIRALRPPFDLVVAADVVYLEDSALHLVAAMEALVKIDGAVLLGYQMRSEEADRVFWERCREVFAVIEKVPREDLDPEYAFEEVDLYVFRKTRIQA